MKYVCELCGYVYDEKKGEPERSVAPGTAFADLPGDYDCPFCGCGKEAFDPAGDDAPTHKGCVLGSESQR